MKRERILAVPEQNERLSLPQFREALRRYQYQPSDATYWRWSVGIVPPALRFLIERPDLLEALAADARALTQEESETVAA